MKCNRCGNENPEGVAFCSACGAPLQPGITVAAPIGQNGPIVSSTLGPNGPATSISVPIKNKKIATVFIIVIAIMICGGVLAAILLGGGKTETYKCDASSDEITISTAGTFKRNQLKKLEYTLIVEGNALGDSSTSSSSRSNNSSFSGSISVESSGDNIKVYAPDNDGWNYYGYDDDDWSSWGSSSSSSNNLLSSPIGMAALGMSFQLAEFDQYSSDPGIEYYESERSNIATYSATIDLDKLTEKTKNAVFDSEELSITPEEFQKVYTKQGFVCSKK